MISKKYYSIVIPTMWKSDKIFEMLPIYEKSIYVKEIIIIDNDPEIKPNLEQFNKIVYYSNGSNIYVNPSWNIGYTLSNYNTILANDDIIINNIDDVFELLLNTDYDIVGMSLTKTNGSLKIEPIESFPANSYGCFIYVKNYTYIPEKYKIWYGDQFLFESSVKKGILKNVDIITNVSETLNANKQELRKNVALNDVEIYNKDGFKLKTNVKKKVLAVLVNYGDEQLNYLKIVTKELKNFKKYDVTIIVNSNIQIDDQNIDKINVYDSMDDYQLLPLTCRSVIIENINEYDIFIYGENDHLFKEIQIDKHIEYSEILPKNRIPGLIQYEENDEGKFYPAYHAHYEWDFNSVEIYDDKKFAHFTNVHQATFILTKEQLFRISEKHNFKEFFGKSRYSVKCKVNTDIYDFCDMKKVICITEFKDNLIHHLPNLYINGDNGRNKNQRSDNFRMNESLIRLLSDKEKIVCGIATTLVRKDSLKDTVNSIINQVDELIVYQNDYYEVYDFLKQNKIKVISGINTGINMGDAGKFYLVDEYPNCYYLSIDDDIIYPKNYVSSIINGLNKYENKVVVSHHGRLFGEKVKNYYTDHVKSVHFRLRNNSYCEVHTPGTGVMGFHTKHVPISFKDFIHPNMADIIVGVKMSMFNIKCVALPHNENWLTDSTKYNKEISLFNSNKNNELMNNYLSQNLVINKSNKNISIIIPTYNSIKYMDDLLNSIKSSAKDLNCEILIGIDSCDDTLGYIKNKTFNETIKFFLFERNVGPYVIKNTLSKISNSDKILFFDSDDIMGEDMLNEVYSLLDRSDVVKPKYVDFNDGENYLDTTGKKIVYGEGVFAIKKDLFLSMNGFEPWRCSADTDFMNRLYNNPYKISSTRKIAFYRRIHNESLTQSKLTGYYSDLRKEYNRISSNRKSFGPIEKLITEPFTIVYTEKLIKENKNVLNDFALEEQKRIISNLNLKIKQSVENESDSNPLNSIQQKLKSENLSKIEHVPTNRNELFEIKRGTIEAYNKKYFPYKRKY